MSWDVTLTYTDMVVDGRDAIVESRFLVVLGGLVIPRPAQVQLVYNSKQDERALPQYKDESIVLEDWTPQFNSCGHAECPTQWWMCDLASEFRGSDPAIEYCTVL